MKYYYSFPLLFFFFSLQAMLESHSPKSDEKKHTCLNIENELAIFAPDKYCDGEFIPQVLLSSKAGREFLMINRVGEKLAARASIEFSSLQTTLVATPVYNLQSFYAVVSDLKRPNAKIDDVMPPCILAEHIADIEWILPSMDCTVDVKQALENTRRNDLILLKTILEKDNTNGAQEAEVYKLPDRLHLTHLMWPPSKDEIFSVLSGYTVIKKALETRKSNNIDAQDDTKWTENWTMSGNYRESQ